MTFSYPSTQKIKIGDIVKIWKGVAEPKIGTLAWLEEILLGSCQHSQPTTVKRGSNLGERGTFHCLRK
jgi:hypothetical protein